MYFLEFFLIEISHSFSHGEKRFYLLRSDDVFNFKEDIKIPQQLSVFYNTSRNRFFTFTLYKIKQNLYAKLLSTKTFS